MIIPIDDFLESYFRSKWRRLTFATHVTQANPGRSSAFLCDGFAHIWVSFGCTDTLISSLGVETLCVLPDPVMADIRQTGNKDSHAKHIIKYCKQENENGYKRSCSGTRPADTVHM